MDKYIAVLISSHFIADFLLQPGNLVQLKKRPVYLFIHGAVHALTTYLVLQNWLVWQVPLVVFFVHILIDYMKQLKTDGDDNAIVFVADQAAHIASLIIIVLVLQKFSVYLDFTGQGYEVIITIAAVSAVVPGSGFFVGKFMKPILENNNLSLKGLENGGKLIGQLERLLILVLIYINQPVGIGFLVAAKSILRFEESKDHQVAEYVIIGTLLSFTLAIVFSITAVWALTFG